MPEAAAKLIPVTLTLLTVRFAELLPRSAPRPDSVSAALVAVTPAIFRFSIVAVPVRVLIRPVVPAFVRSRLLMVGISSAAGSASLAGSVPLKFPLSAKPTY